MEEETEENDENKVSMNEGNSIDYELLFENQSAEKLKKLVEKFGIGNSIQLHGELLDFYSLVVELPLKTHLNQHRIQEMLK